MRIVALVKQVPDTGPERTLRPTDHALDLDAVDAVSIFGGALTVQSKVRAGTPIMAVVPQLIEEIGKRS